MTISIRSTIFFVLAGLFNLFCFTTLTSVLYQGLHLTPDTFYVIYFCYFPIFAIGNFILISLSSKKAD